VEAGVILAVVGAILTFAVHVDLPGIDITVVGLILMIAGGAIIALARRNTRRERVITRVDSPSDPTAPPHTVQHTIVDRDVD